jgi:flavin-dependent dehydrogenase
LTFGSRRLGRDNVIAIGDASGMIDPFTGTGIQIAIRTGEIAAESIIETLGCFSSRQNGDEDPERNNSQPERPKSLYESILRGYERQYEREFHNRMRVAGLLRIAAFSPSASRLIAILLARAPRLTNSVLRATRTGHQESEQIE